MFFNGIEISLTKNGIKISQEAKIKRLVEPTYEKSFSSRSSLAQDICVNALPDIYAAVYLVAPASRSKTTQDKKSLRKAICFLKERKD